MQSIVLRSHINCEVTLTEIFAEASGVGLNLETSGAPGELPCVVGIAADGPAGRCSNEIN